MTGFKMLLAAMMMCVRCKRRTISGRLSVETRMHMSLTDRVVQKCSLPFSLQNKSLALPCPPVKKSRFTFLAQFGSLLCSAHIQIDDKECRWRAWLKHRTIVDLLGSPTSSVICLTDKAQSLILKTLSKGL